MNQQSRSAGGPDHAWPFCRSDVLLAVFHVGSAVLQEFQVAQLFLELVLTGPIHAFKHFRDQKVHELPPRPHHRLPHGPGRKRPADDARKLGRGLIRGKIRVVDAETQHRVIRLAACALQLRQRVPGAIQQVIAPARDELSFESTERGIDDG